MSNIFLVRHGQVAFGGDSYDSLSPLGEEQATAAGVAMRKGGLTPIRTIVGSMNRHRQTADLAAHAARWSAPAEVDRRWDEFDHVEIISAVGDVEPGDLSLSGPHTLRRFFGVAIPRWSSGRYDGDYVETFGAFSGRVSEALRQLAADLDTRETAVVFTSAGVIGWVAASLLEGGEAQWLALIPVLVNTGVTRLRVIDSRLTVISVNEHAHLSRDLETYR